MNISYRLRGYCCDRKARAASAQSFTLWQQATIEITYHDHTVIASSRTSRSRWIAHSTQRRGCNTITGAYIYVFLPQLKYSSLRRLTEIRVNTMCMKSIGLAAKNVLAKVLRW